MAYLLSPERLEKLIIEQKHRDNAVLNYLHYQDRIGKIVHPDADLLIDETINQLVHQLR